MEEESPEEEEMVKPQKRRKVTVKRNFLSDQVSIRREEKKKIP